MIPTIKQRMQLIGEQKALEETEKWVDGLLAENNRLKFQQNQLRLIIGSGEPLHVDHETLLELAQLFKDDLAASRAEVTQLTSLNAALRETINGERVARMGLEQELDHARRTSVYIPVGMTLPRAMTVVVFGHDVTLWAYDTFTIHEVCQLAFRAADDQPHGLFEVRDANGHLLNTEAPVADVVGNKLTISYPIGHGG